MALSDIDRVVVIAEVGINHNGDIDIAKRLIDVAIETGCDAVKFQKRNVDLVYSSEELDKPRESPWGTTNRDQKEGLEFHMDEYDWIDDYCHDMGIEWFASCWDPDSVDFMKRYSRVKYHKVASALLTDDELLRDMKTSGKNVILSTGMSSVSQVSHAINVLGSSLDTVLHCTSTYPTEPDEMNLSVIQRMREGILFDVAGGCKIPAGVRIGFSNHYSGLVWVPMVVALGARVVEFHITLDRTMYGSDQAASIEPDGVRKVVENIRLAEKMLGTGVKRVYDSELPIMAKLRRSVA